MRVDQCVSIQHQKVCRAGNGAHASSSSSVVAEGASGQVALLLLQGDDPRLNAVLDDETRDVDGAVCRRGICQGSAREQGRRSKLTLSDSVRPIHRLELFEAVQSQLSGLETKSKCTHLDSGVPPGIAHNDSVRFD